MALTRAAVVSATAAICFVPFALTAYSGGPPIRRTGAPGDRTCLDSNCHVGVRLEDSPALLFDADLTYAPGSARRRWTIRIDDNAARAYGVQLTTRAAASLTRAPGGTLTAVEPLTSVICDDDSFKGAAGCPASHPVEFFHHTEPRPRNSFTLDWTPPAAPTDVAVYLIANASVAGQRNSRIHQRSVILRPAGAGGVVNAASLGEGVSSGAWFTIFGSALPDADGLEVRIDGRLARIGFASAGQINALAPELDAAPGPIPVEILRHGVTAVTRLAMHRRWAPGLFTTRPTVRAGETARLYGTGFAPSASIQIGGRELPVIVSASDTPGVQIVEFVTPALPPGETSVRAISGDQTTNTVAIVVE